MALRRLARFCVMERSYFDHPARLRRPSAARRGGRRRDRSLVDARNPRPGGPLQRKALNVTNAVVGTCR